MVRGRSGWLCVSAVAVTILATLPYAALSDPIFKAPEIVVRHTAGPRSVGITSSNATRKEQPPQGQQVGYEEYYVEHDISTADAKKAAAALNLDDVPDTLIGCGACTDEEMRYCEQGVVADHCCCERRFVPEPFPWLPHTCYLGPHRCRTILHDCMRYTRLRDCCCLKKMAVRWKGVLTSSGRLAAGGAAMLLVSALLMAMRL